MRNFRHSIAQYFLAASGVALAVFLVASTMAGITFYRRAGVQPMREFIGGDVMVLPVSVDVNIETSGLQFDLSKLKPMDPEGIVGDLQRDGRAFSCSLAVPAYLYTGSPRRVVILGRSSGSQVPHMEIDDGRYLRPEDDTSALLVTRVSSSFQQTGDVATFRVGLYDSASGIFDLARGSDVDFEIVGLSHQSVGTDALIAPLSFLQSATGCPLVSWVGVDVQDYTQLASVSALIQREHPELAILTAEQVLAAVDAEGARVQEAALPLMLLVLGVGCVAMFNTCSLMARLRRREAALMKVLGLSSTAVTAVMVAEGSITAAIGTMVGYGLGTAVGAGIGRVGFGISWVSFEYVLASLFVVVLAAVLPPAIWLAHHPAWEVMRNA
jgi:hypothetical protein